MPLLDAMQAMIGNVFSSVYRDAVLYRPVRDVTPPANNFDPLPADPADPIEFECKAIVEEWNGRLVASGLVKAEDRKITVLTTTLDVEPQIGDGIEVDGYEGRFMIVADGGIPAITSDPARAGWVLRASR